MPGAYEVAIERPECPCFGKARAARPRHTSRDPACSFERTSDTLSYCLVYTNVLPVGFPFTSS
jgi:hypothetical protein